MSAWFVLLVCGLVVAQSLPGGAEGDLAFNDDYQVEDTSLQQLRDTVKMPGWLTRHPAGSPGVAFSAVLSDCGTKSRLNLGGNVRCQNPGRVITNVGDAYDPDTGVFTAPVRGLYYFLWDSGARTTITTRYTTSTRSSDAALLKNGRAVDDVNNTRGFLTRASNSVTLVLEPGDQMSMTTSANRRIRGPDEFSTFSGFLVSSM